jgi:hypothetical protein
MPSVHCELTSITDGIVWCAWLPWAQGAPWGCQRSSGVDEFGLDCSNFVGIDNFSSCDMQWF